MNYLEDAVNTGTVHDAISGAIADYCELHDLDPEGFAYSIEVYPNE